MNLRLLGTGAADGIPSTFGDDPVSTHAREHGGKNVRSRAAALLDGHIKIDLPQDTNMQLQRDGLCGCDWSALFFTHSDADHLAPSEIQYGMLPFTSNDYLKYTIYGNDVVADIVEAAYPDWPIEVVRTRSFESIEHGPYRVTPILANHIPGEDCHNLIFEKDGKALLYATDTGVWKEETWEFLSGFRLDLLVIECTDGFDPTPYEGHLDLAECVEVIGRLRSMSVLGRSSRAVTTHHSVRGMATFCDLHSALAKHGIEAGYDGMELVL